MVFNWGNYLKLSKRLQKISIKDKQLNEACHRTVMSRVYYAVYHIASEFAENKFGYRKKIGIEAGRNHSILPEEFNKRGTVEYRKLAILLKRTRNYRIKSDYDNNIGETEPLMEFTMLQADEAIRIMGIKNS